MFTIDIGENKTEQKSYVLLLPADTFLFIAENLLLAVIVPLVYSPPPPTSPFVNVSFIFAVKLNDLVYTAMLFRIS